MEFPTPKKGERLPPRRPSWLQDLGSSTVETAKHSNGGTVGSWVAAPVAARTTTNEDPSDKAEETLRRLRQLVHDYEHLASGTRTKIDLEALERFTAKVFHDLRELREQFSPLGPFTKPDQEPVHPAEEDDLCCEEDSLQGDFLDYVPTPRGNDAHESFETKHEEEICDVDEEVRMFEERAKELRESLRKIADGLL